LIISIRSFGANKSKYFDFSSDLAWSSPYIIFALAYFVLFISILVIVCSIHFWKRLNYPKKISLHLKRRRQGKLSISMVLSGTLCVGSGFSAP